MWETKDPQPVKLIVGILAADESALAVTRQSLTDGLGLIDMQSPAWQFTQTKYYQDQMGPSLLRQFITFDELIDPGRLADIKHTTNQIEQQLADSLKSDYPRPVNLDPGIIEPSKLVLASTKNFSQRIYIGNRIYAELTLMYIKGIWHTFEYTYPDYKQQHYHDFFNKARNRLREQLKT